MVPIAEKSRNIIGMVLISIYLSGCAWVNAAGRTYEGAGEGLKKAAEETEPGFSKTVFNVGGDICNAVGRVLVNASGEEISSSDTAETYETDEMKLENEKVVVTNVQKRLTELGYNPGVIDGSMGPKTTAAVRKYQMDNHMHPSGDITTELIESLDL
jgi:hypothetical protein